MDSIPVAEVLFWGISAAFVIGFFSELFGFRRRRKTPSTLRTLSAALRGLRKR